MTVYISVDVQQYKYLTDVSKQYIRMMYKIMSDLQMTKRRNTLRERYRLQYITLELWNVTYQTHAKNWAKKKKMLHWQYK